MGVGLCGDIRVSRRLERILDDVTKSGSLVVRKLGADRAAEAGAHRFLGSERVTPQAILEEAAQRTAKACCGRRVVVAKGHDRDQLFRARQGPPWTGAGGRRDKVGFLRSPARRHRRRR